MSQKLFKSELKSIVKECLVEILSEGLFGQQQETSKQPVLKQRRKEIKVKCKKFDDVLENLKPSTIKMDCEGAEYDLLQKPLPDYVKKITMEIHFSKKHWRNDLANKLISLFNDWKVHKKPLIGDKNWHTIGAWYR